MKKRVIYTCITGGYENIVDPLFVNLDWDYICFTDMKPNDKKVSTLNSIWTFKPIPSNLLGLSPVKQQRMIKICPHLYLPEYTESLYVDGSIDIISDINPFIQDYCKDCDIVIRNHPDRNCIYDEAFTVIRVGKDSASIVEPQINRYKCSGFPHNFGLNETGIIYRKHNEPRVVKIMEAWKNEILIGSHRDQLSFNYVLWKLNEKIKSINLNLFSNPYFKWYYKHNRQ